MPILHCLCTLALSPTVTGLCQRFGTKPAPDAVGGVIGVLTRHFTDHSQKLTQALKQSNDRAWRGIELALAGDSWWRRTTAFLTPADARAFRHQVEKFLDSVPLSELVTNAQVRQECLRELQAARKAGLFGGPLDPEALARDAGSFARFDDPHTLLAAEWQTLGDVAAALRRAGHGNLAWFIELRPAGCGESLLATAVRYFFRRAVETDPELFQGLTFSRLENLAGSQEEGFAALHDALAEHGVRLEELLGDVRLILVETQAGVLDVKSEMQRQGQQLRDLSAAVLQALDQHRLDQREVRPGDSLSIRNDRERHLVKALVARYRSLPAGQRDQFPALLNALARLEVASGELDAARQDFRTVADLATEPRAQAEAHYNAYQAALEQRRWEDALAEVRQAARLDPDRFAPFPLNKYEPLRILGAGGFGVAFLCRHRNLASRVVIKSLRMQGLEREVHEVFAEARALEELDHPAIIRVRDCDFAGSRPFLVMDYFEGTTLAEHVAAHGPLPPEELVELVRPIAEGLKAAHERGILHRDIKPGNVLVRRGAGRWDVKLIDFGLALKQAVLYASARTPDGEAYSAYGASLAGTLDYAAPEQLGRLPGAAPGPVSDVYSFAKTCCYALFRTTQPLPRHWQPLPVPLAELLEQSLEEAPDRRPPDFAAVLERLRQCRPAATVPVLTPVEDDTVPVLEPFDEAPAPQEELEHVELVENAPRPRREELGPVLEATEADTVLPADDEPPPVPEAGSGVRLQLLHVPDRAARPFFDAAVTVLLDGKALGKGSLQEGFDLKTEVGPGNHLLEVRWFFRGRRYALPLFQPGGYEVRLRFDRVWNNFTEKLDIRQRS
jgi:serine/threonine protein kinase